MDIDQTTIENKSGYLIGGGIFAGLITSACCAGPLILTILGVSGAATLSSLSFLRVPMIILVILLFGFTGFILYRKRKTCDPNSLCADPKKLKLMVTFYWIGSVIAALGITSSYWILFFI